MKNYTIKERQKIYEHLLTLDCPDLLAALIAQRADKTFMDCEVSEYTSLLRLITNTFLWEKAEEGYEFWFEIQECLYTKEYDTPTVADVIESTERGMFDSVMKVHDVDFESPTEVDFATDKKSSAKIYTSLPIKVDGIIYEPPSFWTKVKLFFGKWGYKV